MQIITIYKGASGSGEELAEAVAEVIDYWMRRQRESKPERPVNVRDLHDHLVAEHEYAGHYRSVLRFVRARYPKPLRFARFGAVTGRQRTPFPDGN
jgi:hypothetical protein